MRQTPAQRHLQHKLAQIASASAAPGGEVHGTAYEMMQMQLANHRRTLKGIQSIERKIDAKRSFLADYETWIDGALASGAGGNDVVLTTVLIWQIDVGNYPRALQIAAYAIEHSLPLPDQYERTLPVALIDELATAAITGKMPHSQALVLLPRVLELTEGHDAPDQARAKLHKALGYALIGKTGSADVDHDKVPEAPARAALAHLQRALDLWDQVGVKKDIERLERHVKKFTPPDPAI